MAVDVRQEDQVKAMVEQAVKDWGRLDIMVNNAGASFRAKPEDISINGWNTVVGINLNGVFLGCKWAGKQMMAQGGGVIINIASVAGVYGSTMMPHYGASKAAVIMLTRELGTAWGRKGIRVNCIAPGPVETEGYLEVLKQAGPDGKKTYDAIAARVGMGRWGKVEEIAYPCLFLASAASSWMTGETIVVDGGPSPRESSTLSDPSPMRTSRSIARQSTSIQLASAPSAYEESVPGRTSALRAAVWSC